MTPRVPVTTCSHGDTLFGPNRRHKEGHLGAGSARLGSFSIIAGTCKKSPDRIMRRMTNCGDHSPAAVTEECVASGATNEGLRKFEITEKACLA